MSERITWTSCPRCGARAAIGWRQRRTWGVGAIRWNMADFACYEGCTLTDGQVLYWSGRKTDHGDRPDADVVTTYGPWSGWWRAYDRPSPDQRDPADHQRDSADP